MVNKKLRYFRIQCNLTQQEIAKEIGVKRTKVAKWEAGLEEIDEENYKLLKDYLINNAEDFIKIYTGILQANGPLGECSTEIAGVEKLN